MTITYGSADFVAATKGVAITAHPTGEQSTTVISTMPRSGEFENFEDLTRKLVQTPKPKPN